MTLTRLLGILLFTAAALPAAAFEFWPGRTSYDRLASRDMKDVYAYLSNTEKLAVARRSEALVRLSSGWTPGYVVGVSWEGKSWRLIGYGTSARQPSNRPPQESGCSRLIDQALARKILALWGKALARDGAADSRIGMDGAFFTFVLKGQHRAGSVWSPDRQSQPRMYGLSQVAESMFEACLTGRGMDLLSQQMSVLADQM